MKQILLQNALEADDSFVKKRIDAFRNINPFFKEEGVIYDGIRYKE